MKLSRINLILAGVVGALAVLAWIGPDPHRGPVTGHLTGLAPADVSHIVVDRRAAPPMELTRTAGGWVMSAPYRIAADAQRAGSLARIAAAASHRRFAAQAAGLAEFGLSPAAMRLRLNGVELQIGGTEPIRRRRYVRSGETVHLIDDLFQHHLLAGPEAFVDPRPFPRTVRAAHLDGATLEAGALREIQQARARQVERGVPKDGGRRLEVWPPGATGSVGFWLDPRGTSLWRADPPLLYRLETPILPQLPAR